MLNILRKMVISKGYGHEMLDGSTKAEVRGSCTAGRVVRSPCQRCHSHMAAVNPTSPTCLQLELMAEVCEHHRCSLDCV